MRTIKGFFDPVDNQLMAWARNRDEYESACDSLCSGFREDNAIVRDIEADDDGNPLHY